MQTETKLITRLDEDMVARAVGGRLTTDDFYALSGKPELMRLADQLEAVGIEQVFRNEDVRRMFEEAGKLPPIMGGSRENDIHVPLHEFAAAAAGSVTKWRPIVNRPYQWRSFFWYYETAEPNADNTFKFGLDYGASATFTALVAVPTNAMGLLDTSAVLTINTGLDNSGSGGGAGTAPAAGITRTRIAADQLLRCVATMAGTGTIPAINVGHIGVYL